MEKILIADDEQLMRQLVIDFLRPEGYEILEASDGKEALEIYDKEHPDLILLDVMMPGYDGWTVCREIRRESTVPIMMLTAKGEEIDQLFAYDLSADEYITKPFSPKILVAKIKALYKKRRDLMCESMKKYFPEGVSFTYPEGGLFTWVTLPEGLDAKAMMPEVIEKKVAYVPGGAFYPNGGHANHFRLNYSNMPEDRIVEGIKRLAEVLKEKIGK